MKGAAKDGTSILYHRYFVLYVPTKNQHGVFVGMTAMKEMGKRTKGRDEEERNKG
jgi:hypothetical protein